VLRRLIGEGFQIVRPPFDSDHARDRLFVLRRDLEEGLLRIARAMGCELDCIVERVTLIWHVTIVGREPLQARSRLVGAVNKASPGEELAFPTSWGCWIGPFAKWNVPPSRYRVCGAAGRTPSSRGRRRP